MPILGIVASSNYPRVTDTGVYFPLGAVTVGSAGAASVTFSSIPATYTHLQVRCLVKSTTAGSTFENGNMTINSNTMTRRHFLYGDGASIASGSSTTNLAIINVPAAGFTNIFSSAIIDILDYTNTNKNKTIRSLTGVDTNGSGELALYSALYAVNTNAITSLTFSTSNNLAQYSQFALYGIKGA
jgi:hypothetical protein